MTSFKDREKGFETKFALDQDMVFRVTARRNRLVGEWAAELMGLTQEEAVAYGKAVVQADFEEAGDEDVIRKLTDDLASAGVEIEDATIRATLNEKAVEARRQLAESTG